MPFNEANEWKPNKKQAKFLAIPFSVKEALYGGGAGSGKSELLLMYPIVHKLHENPNFKQVLLRRTTKQLKKEIVPRSREFYLRFGASFNESDMVWTFPRLDQFGSGYRPNGAKIFLSHCENENDVHNYDSMEINLFTPDEITSLTEYIYLYIGFTRVRTSDPNLPAIIRAAGMPGDVGHTFVKKRFVDPAPEGGRLLIGKGGIKRVYIHTTLADNPHIDPGYAQSLEVLPEAEKNAKRYGSWEAYLGQVFEDFRDIKYPDEPENAIHLVDPFEVPDWWPKLLAIDWGFNAMCSVGWAAVSPDKRIVVYRHQMFYRKKVEEWGPFVKHFIDVEKPVDAIICHSASQNRGDPHTIQEQVSAALGMEIRLGERDRIAGKQLLHEALRWKVKEVPESLGSKKYDPEHAAWILRNRGLKEYHSYLSSFGSAGKEQENIPKLLFFNEDNVKVICKAIKSCIYAKSGTDGKKAEDVAEFDGDDPYDMLRLLLHACDRFFGDAISKKAELDGLQRIYKRLEDNPDDITGWYRNLKQLESTTKKTPIRLFHSRGRR